MTDPAGREATPACEPPCPVAAGRRGLLCTCGNAGKRLRDTFDRLDAERDALLATAREHHERCPDWPSCRAEDCDWCAAHGSDRKATACSCGADDAKGDLHAAWCGLPASREATPGTCLNCGHDSPHVQQDGDECFCGCVKYVTAGREVTCGHPMYKWEGAQTYCANQKPCPDHDEAAGREATARERALLDGPYCEACNVPEGFPHVPSCRLLLDSGRRPTAREDAT